jgi:hypothetical protein
MTAIKEQVMEHNHTDSPNSRECCISKGNQLTEPYKAYLYLKVLMFCDHQELN